MNDHLKLFEPIVDADISHSIARQIKELIRKGKLEPGDRLPSERELTRELQVSRSALREAFHALEATGFVRVLPGKGTFITDPAAAGSTLESMMWGWLNGGQKALSELFEVRLLLEVEAAGLAAERVNGESLQAIKDALRRIAQAAERRNPQEMAEADLNFHRCIFLAANNSLLLTLIDAIAVPLAEMRLAAFQLSGGLPQTVRNHVLLLEAIQSRDSDQARRAMMTHLDSTRRNMMVYLAQLAEPTATEAHA